MELAKQICFVVEQPFDIPNYPGLKISSSIGVALYPDHASTHTQLMKLADNAMYKVKESGRNAVQFSQLS
jgi:diguanylate cyclase (GGDEF)-like protein